MSTIGFCMLSHTGHLNPTFKFAAALRARGHRVCYLSAPDWIDMGHSFADSIRAHGFEVIPLAPHAQSEFRSANRQSFNSYFPAMGRDLAHFAEEACPSLLVVDALLPPLALKAYELGITTAILSVVLPRRRAPMRPPLLTTIVPQDKWSSRAKIAFAWHRHNWSKLIGNVLSWSRGKTNLYQLTRQMAKRVNYQAAQIHYDTVFSPELGLPELIVCGPEFDFPWPASATHYHYVGPSVDLARDEKSGAAFPWERIATDKTLIFCTLGSESTSLKHSRQFFQTVIHAFAAKPEWQLIVAIGNRMQTSEFPDLPANVVLVNWAPHLEILKKTAVMINHGGLGTLKECILSGVPMIVFPSTSDQPGNAARVVYHGLGLAGDPGRVTAPQIQIMVQTLLTDSMFRKRTKMMGRKFREMDDSQKGVEIFEGLIASKSAGRSV